MKQNVIVLLDPTHPPHLTEEEWAYCVDVIGYEPLSQSEADEMLKNFKPERAKETTPAQPCTKKPADDTLPAFKSGSPKQKNWAYDIRKAKTKEMDERNAEAFGRFAQAKFWIENRKMPGKELARRLEQLNADYEVAKEQAYAAGEVQNGNPTPEQWEAADKVKAAQRAIIDFFDAS